MLAIRKTLSCAIDLDAASSAGWGNLVYYTSFEMMNARESPNSFFCPQRRCDVWRLQTFDLHLRAMGAKQMQRGKVIGTPTKMSKKKKNCRTARMRNVFQGDSDGQAVTAGKRMKLS